MILYRINFLKKGRLFMKRMRKIAAAVVAALAAMSMGVVLSVSAATDYSEPVIPIHNPNTTDSSWPLSGSSVLKDYCRRKYNDTSIYVTNSTGYAVSVNVYGRKTKTGADVDVSGTSFSTTNLTLPANSVKQIRQLIHEKNCSYAHIYFGGTGGSGLWSPDSVGNYPKIN